MEEEQRKARQEEKAQNAAQAANERRQQIREERVRRAKVIQQSQNTGVSDSSGELGSTSGLSTQLGANLGNNTGRLNSANNISGFAQNAADFNSQAENSLYKANMWGQIGSVSMSIFSAAGGFGAMGGAGTQSPAPVSNANIRTL